MSAVHRLDLGPSVAVALKEAIFRGELAPGTRLVEAELADQFATSRGPVRDALVELEQSGLVAARPRRGCVVREFDAADIEEIYTLRLVLESLAVDRLVARTDIEPSAVVEAALDSITRAHATGDRVAVGRADMAFHRSIVEMSGHRRLLDAWERLADQTMLLMTMLISVDPIIQAPAGDHTLIAQSLARGDGAAARQALDRHLASARTAMSGAQARIRD